MKNCKYFICFTYKIFFFCLFLFFLFFSIFLISFSDCHENTEKKKEVLKKNNLYKKKIGFYLDISDNFLNKCGLNTNIGFKFIDSVIKNKNVVMIDCNRFCKLNAFFYKKHFNNYKKILELARKNGLDCIIVQRIIECNKINNKRSGFKKNRVVCKKIRIETYAIDVSNLTIIFNVVKKMNLKISVNMTELEICYFNNSIFNHLRKVVNLVCDKILMGKWKTVIFSAIGSSVVLPIGNEVGAEENIFFNVFSRRSGINGFRNKPFFYYGRCIGKITIYKVKNNYSFGRYDGNYLPSAGDIVK